MHAIGIHVNIVQFGEVTFKINVVTSSNIYINFAELNQNISFFTGIDVCSNITVTHEVPYTVQPKKLVNKFMP